MESVFSVPVSGFLGPHLFLFLWCVGAFFYFAFSTPSEGAASVVFGDCETLSSLRPANACHPDRLVGGRLF